MVQFGLTLLCLVCATATAGGLSLIVWAFRPRRRKAWLTGWLLFGTAFMALVISGRYAWLWFTMDSAPELRSEAEIYGIWRGGGSILKLSPRGIGQYGTGWKAPREIRWKRDGTMLTVGNRSMQIYRMSGELRILPLSGDDSVDGDMDFFGGMRRSE